MSVLSPGDPDGVDQFDGPENPSVMSHRSWWQKKLDGRDNWGVLVTGRACYGFRSYRLYVYPPGITTVDRRILRVALAWPRWGAVMWLTLLVVRIPAWHLITALCMATVVCVSIGAVIHLLSAHVRAQVRMASVICTPRMPGDLDDRLTEERLLRMVSVLRAADNGLRNGSISPVHHERLWWLVYDQVKSESGNSQRLWHLRS